MMYTTCGKQVLRNGVDFAQACDPGAATLIADTLNARRHTPATRDDRGNIISPVVFRSDAPVRNLTEHVVGCRAYQASDQMICPCGLAWDVNDSDPPRCRA